MTVNQLIHLLEALSFTDRMKQVVLAHHDEIKVYSPTAVAVQYTTTIRPNQAPQKDDVGSVIIYASNR